MIVGIYWRTYVSGVKVSIYNQRYSLGIFNSFGEDHTKAFAVDKVKHFKNASYSSEPD